MDTTNNESGLLSGFTDTISVIFGSTTITPTAAHSRWALIMGAVAGWILGVARGKKKPNSNFIGM